MSELVQTPNEFRKTEQKKGLEKLREPFADRHISKLPKPYKKDSQKGNCKECGGYHGLPAAHLSYVGHAALTHRLLDADPEWTWEPMAIGQDGYPVIDDNGGMWIKLTVCGVTRLGYGDAQGKTGGDAMKERIGDALRNAAMRFGAALDLWHKGELFGAEDETEENNLLSSERFEELKEEIKAQVTKPKAKAVWQKAVKECSDVGDTASAELLKQVLLDHAKHIDDVEKKEKAEA